MNILFPDPACVPVLPDFPACDPACSIVKGVGGGCDGLCSSYNCNGEYKMRYTF